MYIIEENEEERNNEKRRKAFLEEVPQKGEVFVYIWQRYEYEGHRSWGHIAVEFNVGCQLVVTSLPPLNKKLTDLLKEELNGKALYVLSPEGFFYLHYTDDETVITQENKISDDKNFISSLANSLSKDSFEFDLRSLNFAELEDITTCSGHRHNMTYYCSYWPDAAKNNNLPIRKGRWETNKKEELKSQARHTPFEGRERAPDLLFKFKKFDTAEMAKMFKKIEQAAKKRWTLVDMSPEEVNGKFNCVTAAIQLLRAGGIEVSSGKEFYPHKNTWYDRTRSDLQENIWSSLGMLGLFLNGCIVLCLCAVATFFLISIGFNLLSFGSWESPAAIFAGLFFSYLVFACIIGNTAVRMMKIIGGVMTLCVEKATAETIGGVCTLLICSPCFLLLSPFYLLTLISVCLCCSLGSGGSAIALETYRAGFDGYIFTKNVPRPDDPHVLSVLEAAKEAQLKKETQLEKEAQLESDKVHQGRLNVSIDALHQTHMHSLPLHSRKMDEYESFIQSSNISLRYGSVNN